MPFELQSTHLDAVKVIAPKIFPDHRGYFMEAYHKEAFARLGITADFVQDNQSYSIRNVVRGLHFQWEPPMAKLMRVTLGVAFLVAVDIRPNSPTLGRWVGLEVSAENQLQVWAPAGFARGFCALSEAVVVHYKCTAMYNPACEGGIRWNDPDIGIDWPVQNPILSDKDAHAPSLAEWLARPESAQFAFRE